MREQRFQSNENRIHHNREIILGNFDKIYYYSRWSLHCFHWIRFFFNVLFSIGRALSCTCIHDRTTTTTTTRKKEHTRMKELSKSCKTHLNQTINEYFAGYLKYKFTSIHGIKSYENYKFVIFCPFFALLVSPQRFRYLVLSRSLSV